MKATGQSNKGRHLPKNISKSNAINEEGVAAEQDMLKDQEWRLQETAEEPVFVRSENAPSMPAGKKKKFYSGVWRKILIGLGLLVIVTVTVLALDIFGDAEFFIKPPPLQDTPRPPSWNPGVNNPTSPSPDPIEPDNDPGHEYGPYPDERQPGVITFLVLGIDTFANTDAILVVSFDTVNYKLNVVSIPRDTLVNVEWSTKKANSILYNMRVRHTGEDDQEKKAMLSTIDVFGETILGFKVDFVFTIRLRGFAALVDAIGGVDFYVPARLYYQDDAQNLHIDYQQRMYRGLTGQQALEIIRFRRYSNGDIGRIDTQQDFLMAAAEQILEKKNSIRIDQLAQIFLDNVNTDLGLQYVAWLGRELLKLDAESINFMIMPGVYNDTVGNSSYITICVEEWLDMVNTYLYPWSDEVTEDNVSILTRGADRRLYVTDGNRRGDPTWGASSRGPDNPYTGTARGGTSNPTTPTRPSPSPSPVSSPSPSPTWVPSVPPDDTPPPDGTDPPTINDPDTAPANPEPPSGTNDPPEVQPANSPDNDTTSQGGGE